jgi:hypothetical protein
VERTIIGLRDPAHAECLEQDGYVRVGPLLSVEECRRLEEVFHEAMRRTGRPLGTAWFPTILFPEDEVRRFITDEVGAVVLPKLDAVVDRTVLEPVRVDYSVKPPGADGELGPHQDFSIVDERRWTSLYLWIPLVDTDEGNGTLHVLPGSHRYTNRVRARHVPATFDRVLQEVHERSVRLDCRAGELVLMVSGVVHHSPSNRSDHLRLAAHGILKPIEAPLVFFYADEDTPDGEVEMYEVGIDQYVHLALGGRPDPGLPLAGHCDRPPAEMTPERFAAGAGGQGA